MTNQESRGERIAAGLEEQIALCSGHIAKTLKSACRTLAHDDGDFFSPEMYRVATALLRASAQLTGLLIRVDAKTSGSIPQ